MAACLLMICFEIRSICISVDCTVTILSLLQRIEIQTHDWYVCISSTPSSSRMAPAEFINPMRSWSIFHVILGHVFSQHYQCHRFIILFQFHNSTLPALHHYLQTYALRLRQTYALRLRQDDRHFTDDVFRCIFMNENVWIPLKVLMKIFF